MLHRPTVLGARLHQLFQSSPAHRDGCCLRRTPTFPPAAGVSILTRPQGRVLPRRVVSFPASAWWFQSSPAHRDGCCSRPGVIHGHHLCFNPHPPTGTGAAAKIPAPLQHSHVSILTRPQGRVLLSTLNWVSPGLSGFQSSPAHRDGCCAL